MKPKSNGQIIYDDLVINGPSYSSQISSRTGLSVSSILRAMNTLRTPFNSDRERVLRTRREIPKEYKTGRRTHGWFFFLPQHNLEPERVQPIKTRPFVPLKSSFPGQRPIILRPGSYIPNVAPISLGTPAFADD